MIVHQPESTCAGGNVVISCRLEMKSPPSNLTGELWYRFPEQYGASSINSDGFAAPALLVAMSVGEDVVIRGPISPKLAYNLVEYRDIFHLWMPAAFKMVDIKYERIEPIVYSDQGRGMATVFSGGVDSFFTLFKHLPDQQDISDARITHGLFIQGFDLRLDEESTFQALAKKYTQLFHSLGLDLILASTNAYQLSEFHINWAMFFGAPLIGAALLLGPLLRRVYIPSGLSYQEAAPQGSSPLIDHLLSTEYMDIVHHGASFNRFEKLEVLTRWTPTYDLLRVCSIRRQSIEPMNCSACHKCYRTRAALSILGALPKYPSFSPKFTVRDFFHWGLQTQEALNPVKILRKKAWKSGDIPLALGIQITLTVKWFARFFTAAVKKILPKHALYTIKRHLLDSELMTPGENP